jgi:hypothetical protein
LEKFGLAQRHHSGKVTKKSVKQRTSLRQRKRLGLAQDLDEFRKFTTRVFLLPMSESGDMDGTPVPIGIDNLDWPLEDLSNESFNEAREVEFESESGLNKSESREDATGGIKFTLTPDIFKQYMDRLDEIGPTPSMESCKQND